MDDVGEEVLVKKADQQQQEVKLVVRLLDNCALKPQDDDQTVGVDEYQAEEGQELEYDVVVRYDSKTTVTAKAFHT